MKYNPSYKSAIEWIVYNDDTEFLENGDGEEGNVSVATALIMDLYEVDLTKVLKDLRKRKAEMDEKE